MELASLSSIWSESVSGRPETVLNWREVTSKMGLTFNAI